MMVIELAEEVKMLINREIESFDFDSYYGGLYEPLGFSLNLPSKRVRPILCILSAQMYEGTEKKAMDAALGLEYFHTFTLIHDDIMDNAELRRGKTTIHKKNGLNTAILSGDVLYTLALQKFEAYPPEIYKKVMSVFNEASKKVCEGQQKDMEFESANNVELSGYLKMIENKTAVLAAAALKIGGIIGKASEEEQELLYDFGINLGMTFQLMDDYLDSFGDEEKFGKKIGGDIIQKKKTYLLLKCQEVSTQKDVDALNTLLADQNIEEKEKIDKVKAIFKDSEADTSLLALAEDYHQKNTLIYSRLSGNDIAKKALNDYVTFLLNRSY